MCLLYITNYRLCKIFRASIQISSLVDCHNCVTRPKMQRVIVPLGRELQSITVAWPGFRNRGGGTPTPSSGIFQQQENRASASSWHISYFSCNHPALSPSRKIIDDYEQILRQIAGKIGGPTPVATPKINRRLINQLL